LKLDLRLLSLLRSHKLILSLAILAGFAGGVLIVLQARALSRTVSLVFLSLFTLSDVTNLLVILLILILVRGGLIWGGDHAAKRLALRIKTELRMRLYDHLNQLGPGYLKTASQDEGIRTGELVNVVNQGIEALDAYFSQYLPQLALSVLVPLTVLAFVLPVDTLSGLVLLFTAPLIPIFMVLIADQAERLTRRQWRILSRMSAHFLDVLQGLLTLKIFGRSQAQAKVIAQIGERYRQTTMGVLRVTFLSALVLEWVAMLSTAVVAVEIGLRLLYGRLTFEQAFFVLLLTPEFYLPLRLLGTRFHAGMAGVTAAGRIFEILEIQPERFKPSELVQEPLDRESSGISEPVSITFEDVYFVYPGEREALRGVSFNIPAGETVALVGASGAGKSTVADLLLGFIAPQAGQITMDDLPLAPSKCSQLISWVPQNPYLFNTSVADNIRLARPEASLDEVITAAKLAYAHDFISHLPKGYDTQIGERGARLSAGQAQRLALARAFLKDAPLLILDEATANLDPETSAHIQAAIQTLAARRTALVIAHRLNTVQDADQIVVLQDGQVFETGTHEQLFELGGAYRKFLEGELISTGTAPSPISRDIEFAQLPEQIPALPSIPAKVPAISLTSLASLVRLLSPYKWFVVLSVLLGWVTVVSGIGLLATSAYLISAAALQPSIAVLQVPIVGVRFFGLARGLFRYLERYVSHDTTFRLLARLRVWFFQTVEPLAPARLMAYQSGDLLNRIHQDINSLEDFYVRVISPPLVWLLVTISASIFLATFSLELGLVLLLFQILAGLVTPILVRYASRSAEKGYTENRAALSAALVDGIQGMADLQAFGASGQQGDKIASLNRLMASDQSRLGFLSSIESAVENVLVHLAYWTIMLLAIPLVSSGEIEGVYLAALLLVSLASFEAAAPLPQAAHSMESSLAAASRLDEVISTPPEVSDLAAPLAVPQAFNLQIKDLHFSYPSMSGANLNPREPSFCLNIDHLHLPPGKRLAVVGPSGAGKTTLANLLLRFWDFHEGEIQLAGEDIRGYRQEDVRALIRVVTQRTHLFNATLVENLRLARPDANQDEIVQACRLAQIHDFITSLPQGYNTWIGEGGLRLSAGQRQRIALARALIKDAPLLILDEPTANLDTITESELLKSLLSLIRDRTTLWITHRLVGMQAMDEILVLRRGEIIEQGSHEELLELNGMYRRMWGLQHQILM
jgi:ATP-binding cassette subfamily C protein CydCD